MISFKVSGLNVKQDFKIQLIVLGPEIGSAILVSLVEEGCYRLKIRSLNHSLLVKSRFETQVGVSFQYSGLSWKSWIIEVEMKAVEMRGALKQGFRAYRRELLGLDGSFIKGPFPGQVLAAVGLDSNNGIYPLAMPWLKVKEMEIDRISYKHVVAACWNMALNDRATPPKKRSNNAEATGSASRQAQQQVEPVVGQDDSGGSRVGAIIDSSPPSQISAIIRSLPFEQYQQDSDESNNEKRAKMWTKEFEWKRSLFEIDLTFGINAFDLDKGTEVMKDKVSQEHIYEEDVPLNNNIGKKSGSNHVVKKGSLEFLVCKQVANHGGGELVDKGRPLKRKRVYAE
nr:protein FAR1-related sequence 5-like isoform X2 [Tanacetum cinerariifolium]